MIRFLEDIKNTTKYKSNLRIDLSSIQSLTVDGILVLVSHVADPKLNHGMLIAGNVPGDERLQDMFVASGFYEHVQSARGKGQGSHGSICRKHSRTVESDTANEMIRFAAEHMGWTNSTYPAVQRTLIEIMSNTWNHATANRVAGELWWASVYCDREREVACFSFVDNGVGIFNSVQIKGVRRVARRLGLDSNAALLGEILDGKIQSRTGFEYRGKGLPALKADVARGMLTNVILISNDVYADLSQSKFEDLQTYFRGTFFYWELRGS